MPNDIYSAIFDGVTAQPCEIERFTTPKWAIVKSDAGFGACMYVDNVDCHRFALVNSYYNRGSRYYEPFENFCTSGLDFTGKTVGIVGHMTETRRRYSSQYKKCYMFDFNPKDDDDLDPALEDEYLPQCDIVVITGSSIVNGTLPHLLELCEKAYTILVGPSVPQCEALLDFGIDRLAGLVLEKDKMESFISGQFNDKMYAQGHPFLISKNKTGR